MRSLLRSKTLKSGDVVEDDSAGVVAGRLDRRSRNDRHPFHSSSTSRRLAGIVSVNGVPVMPFAALLQMRKCVRGDRAPPWPSGGAVVHDEAPARQ